MGDIILETYLFESRTLPGEAFEVFFELFEAQKLCDVTLIVGDKKLKCHRVVLASCSPYFRSMFTNEMAESFKDVIPIQGLAESAVTQLLTFIYSRKILINLDNIEALLTAASVLQLDSVAHACCEFMKSHLHPTNCLEMRAYAELHGCADFLEVADIYARRCFLSLVNTDTFLNLSLKHTKQLITGTDLCVKSEEQVFDAVMAWVRYDEKSRKGALPELLGQVHLPLLPIDTLIQRVEKDPLIANSLCCRNLVDEAKNYKLCPHKVNSFRTLPRKSTTGVLFSVGGRGKSGEPFRTIECFDWLNDRWFPVPELSTSRRHVALASFQNKIYAIGGHDGTQHLSSVECFDPLTNKWSDVLPMESCRRGMSADVLEGVIYVAGGLDEATCYDTVERFDPENKEWSMVAPMQNRRGGVGVAALNGYLYAVGGNDGTTSLLTVERYNPHTNKWTLVANMNRRRAGVGVTVVGDTLYAAGGFDDSLPLDSVEIYSPHSCSAWQYVASMSVCRGGVGAASMGGRVWAVGGHNGSQYLSSVECYCPLTDKWELVSSMATSRAGAGVAGCLCDVELIRKAQDGQLHTPVDYQEEQEESEVQNNDIHL